MTASDKQEIEHIIDILENTDAGAYVMHEGFDCNGPGNFTRHWFAWANSLFAELVMKYTGITVIEKY